MYLRIVPNPRGPDAIVRPLLEAALSRAGELLAREIQDIQKGNPHYEDAKAD